MDKTLRLENEKIGRLIMEFSIPAMVGMLVNALYNIVDRIFVGNGVGAIAISGIVVTFPIIMVVMAFSMLIGIGATSLVSIKLGQKKKEEAEVIVANALTLSIVVSLAITALGYMFMEPMLSYFGGSGEALKYAVKYSNVFLIGTLFQTVAFAMNNVIRGEGNPKMALSTMIVGAVLNTILNPIFIFGFKMGIEGSALATVISQFVSAAWVMWYFVNEKSHLKIKIKNMKLKSDIVKSIFTIGSAPFAMQMAASLVIIIFNRGLGKYGGDIAISAMGVINSVAMVFFMPVFGINQGIQPIIGYNFGANRPDRVAQTLKIGSIAATVVATLGFIVCMFFAEGIVSVFSRDHKELIEVAGRGFRIIAIMYPIIGFQIVGAGYFQAVGKPKQSIILSLSRQVILLIPLVLILPLFFKLDGIWIAVPVSDFISFLLTTILIMKEFRQKKTGID